MNHHDPLKKMTFFGDTRRFSHEKSWKSNDSRGRVWKTSPYSPYENGTDHADSRGEGALNDREDRVGNKGSTHDLCFATKIPTVESWKAPTEKN